MNPLHLLLTSPSCSLGFEDPKDMNHVADMVQKQRSSSISEFEITRDGSCSTWYVNGAGLQRFVQMTNWRYVNNSYLCLLVLLTFSSLDLPSMSFFWVHAILVYHVRITSVVLPILFCLISSYKL